MKKRRIIDIGDKISLKEFIPDDAPVIFALIEANKEHLSQNGENIPALFPTEKAVLDSIENPKHPKQLRFGIWVDEKMIGGINALPVGKRTARIGYWLAEKDQGSGYAGKSVCNLIWKIFQTGNIDFAEARVAKTNKSSLRLLGDLDFFTIGEDKDGILQLRLKRWLPFYLHTMTFCGLVRSWTKWNEVLKIYEDKWSLEGLKTLKHSNQDPPEKYPDFGLQPYKYDRHPTLGQWAERNNINLAEEAI